MNVANLLVATSAVRVAGILTFDAKLGQFAASVTVYSGGLDSAGTQCVGTQLGTAAVSTIDGAWSFRQRNITPPTQVCVKSPFGGIDSSAVTITN